MSKHTNSGDFALVKQALSDRSIRVWICLAIVALVAGAYWRVTGNGFIYFDDHIYIFENVMVQAGLTVSGFNWACTSMNVNWHPLTWLSHMLDCQLFGLSPAYHHLSSLLLHTINSLLLFHTLSRLLSRATKKNSNERWQRYFPAAMAAILFAVHPIHVESVAWASERKDLLSTLFWILTLLAYIRYVEQPTGLRYIVMVCAMATGLTAKAMLVTMPFVLLLLDHWPFERVNRANAAKIVLEKAPLFLLAFIASLITYQAQKLGGAVSSLQGYPLVMRINNAAVAYLSYIIKLFWPVKLGLLYPFPLAGQPVWLVMLGFISLGLLLLLALRSYRERPWITVGVLWYLGTLVPVIGIIKVGLQSMADRYAYIPFIGLYLALAYSLASLARRYRLQKALIIATAASALILVILANLQVGRWRNTETIFKHTLSVTSDNYAAHNVLAYALLREKRYDDAIEQWQASIRINPTSSQGYSGLASTYAERGDVAAAIKIYRELLSNNNNLAEVHNNLGFLLIKQGASAEALTHFEMARRLDPNLSRASSNLAAYWALQGQFDKAIVYYRDAIRIEPGFLEAQYNLGLIYHRVGDKDKAQEQYRKLKELDGPLADKYQQQLNKMR